MSVTPLHLLGSLRFPLFGTGTTRPSCHSSKSTLSCQNELRCSKRLARLFFVSDLNASGGTLLSPGALPFFNFAIACCNYSHVISESSSIISDRCGMESSVSHTTCRWFVYTFSKCGPITDSFSASVDANVPVGNISCITVGVL